MYFTVRGLYDTWCDQGQSPYDTSSYSHADGFGPTHFPYSHVTYSFPMYLDMRFVFPAPQSLYWCARQVFLLSLSNTVSLLVC
jgi:hypothetical protein